MEKMLLLSVIMVNAWLAGRAGMSAHPRRALVRLVCGSTLFNLFYLFLLLYVWPRVLVYLS